MTNRRFRLMQGLTLTATLLSTFIFSVAGVSAAPGATQTTMELGAPFTDNAVLQRDMSDPVWGWTRPGATVTVKFAGQTYSAVANQQGKWTVKLHALKASFKPRSMTIQSSTGEQQTIKDILVGEVWLASGQSNMELPVNKTSANLLVLKPVNGTLPIREFTVTGCYAQLQPIEKTTGKWVSDDYRHDSAIAFTFADMLYQELHVPIGILNCSFSTTQIQAWTPRIGFEKAKDAYSLAFYKEILETDPRTPQHKAAWDRFYKRIAETLKANPARIKAGKPALAIPSHLPGNINSNRDATWLFNARLNPVVPYAIRGAIWNQGYANIGEGLVYYNNLHSLIRGWRAIWGRPNLPVYFHQFYTPGKGSSLPSIDEASEMRLGTWLARDIPHADMASQIDIGGGVHYFNKAVPGMRLALLALKYQYPGIKLKPTTNFPAWQMPASGQAADIVAHGPMFKSYTVEGNRLIVTFNHTDGGLVVAQTSSGIPGRAWNNFANPQVIVNGDDQMKLFYLADAQRVWHQARMTIAGDKVVLTAPGVSAPMGVSYATSGVASLPDLYNKALLPTTPFIYYDHKLVTSTTWPAPSLKVAGLVLPPTAVGIEHVWSKMPILSTQFRDNAVLQAGQPITIWGSAASDNGHLAKGDAVIKFSFDGIKKTIHVNQPGPNIINLGTYSRRRGVGREWFVTVPAMKASDQPKTLKVSFFINGKLAHQQIVHDIVIGDVWYVAAPVMNLNVPSFSNPDGMVRVMKRRAESSMCPRPALFSVAISHEPGSRFACKWVSARQGFAGWLGTQIHAKTGEPVGIIFMQNTILKPTLNPSLSSWIPALCLKNAPSLAADYASVAGVIPGTRYYNANVHRYVAAWKQYWHSYIPQLIATKAVPPNSPWGTVWGHRPHLSAMVTTKASQTWNMLVNSFTPMAVKGIIFLTSPAMFRGNQGSHFAQQMSVLANGWKHRFDVGHDMWFFYTMPSRKLAAKITAPTGIQGRSEGLTITRWPGIKKTAGTPSCQDLVQKIVAAAYK